MKLLRNSALGLWLIYSLHSMATTFIPIPVKDKVESSDVVIFGTYQGKNYKKNNQDKVVTEITFKVDKSLGLSFNQLSANSHFKFQIPGGVWGERSHTVYGVPQFAENDKTQKVMLLKSLNGEYWAHHLAAGKFNLVEKDGKKYLQSDVFSDQKNIGLIEFSKFEEILEESHFKQALQTQQSEKHVAKSAIKRKIDRKLASEIDAYNENNKVLMQRGENFTTNFLVVLLIIFGLVFTYTNRRKR